MTCDTSLMYGHGANAHAAYPGLTGGKKANHLWLRLAVIESEDTRARLGDARTEKERLERAVDAYAQFLGQPRPDSMVSDLLHEPPAPAVVPAPTRTVVSKAARARSVTHHDQRHREAQPREYRLSDEQKRRLVEMREERELAGTQAWNQRPYGGHNDQELTKLIATGPVDARREDEIAAAAEESERALLQEIAEAEAGGTSLGQIEVAPIYVLLDQADEHLAAARVEQAREQAAAEVAATADEHLRVLGAADGKSRFALRMAGTSRKEHTQLTKQAEADRAAAWHEGVDARVAARQAAADAWKVLRDSPYVTVLGATERQAPDVDTLAARLTEMRETKVPARAQQKDTGDEKRVARFHGQATTARENAAKYRATAKDARTEKQLRERISEQHPRLHESEVKARADLQKAQAQQTARVVHQSSPSYRPPTQGQSGPKQRR
ncbi:MULTISPECIES: hypothetical protein [Streptomyces]|uniref:hypothetical protein n=1 Tax=Streptomyces TaxID=1883 RepID=UPI002E28E3FF|nr:hypothetical protein [[Kitasatospora] papulosa]